VPPAKKAPSSRRAADPRVIIAEIPTEGDLAGYVIAAHTDGSGDVINKFDVLEIPMPGTFKALTDEGIKVVKTGKLGEALRYIAGRVDTDLKEFPTEGAPVSNVTPIRKKAAAPVKKAPAKKVAPRATKAVAKKAPPARKAVAGPAKKASATKKVSRRAARG
jgi:hypothetical protein